MTTINKIQEYIATNFKSDCCVNVVEPLTYINTLAEPKGKILLIYKSKPKTQLPVSTIQKEDSSISGNGSQLDVTGTPLEDDCDITVISDWSTVKNFVKTNSWTDEEEQYDSINEDLATKIVNEVNVDGPGTKCTSGSMFALCDASNGDYQFLLNIEYDKMWNWRGVGKFTGLVPLKQIDLPSLMKKHLSMIRGCNNAKTEIQTFFTIKPNQSVKCTWETTSLTPSLKCNHNGNVVVAQSVPVGDLDSPIEKYWRQLEILDGIKQDIERYKKTQNNDDLVYRRCASPLDIEKIQNHILDALSNINIYDAANETDTFDLNSVIGRMETDKVQDVTDQLWTVLRFCGSFKDLLNAFHYVFQCAAQSIVVNTPKSKNRLASLICDISEKRNIPLLSGSEPLEILLEIGLQKLSKDYEHIFTDSKIFTATGFQTLIRETSDKMPVNDRKTLHHAVETNRLNKNMPMAMAKLSLADYGYTRFDKLETDRCLGKLAQVHLILEHIMIIQTSLNLDHNVIRSVVNGLPKSVVDFARVKNVKYDKRDISVPVGAMLAKVENLTPQAIKVTMKSENRFRHVSDTFFYSIDPICPPNVFPYMQSSEEVVNKELLYCGLHYIKLGSSRM